MIGDSTLFPKQIKLDDYASQEDNFLTIVESSNLLLGSGSRTSLTAVVLAKTLHLMSQERALSLAGKHLLELGCGVGLLGVYLGCLGAHVIMGDFPSMRELAEQNIRLNKKMLRGSVEFATLNWKEAACSNDCEKGSEGSTSSEQHKLCLRHVIDQIDLTVVCECGGLQDVGALLQWRGKEGMILCFLEREHEISEEYLNGRALEEFLAERDIDYDRIQSYHPDYIDHRVRIYRISQANQTVQSVV